jgi:apolipoprotein D and lipocalin family protein
VENFQLDRYLGTWYEIARLPHGFEKNLERVTATYSLRDDGKIRVLNRGFNIRKEKWSEAEGRAWIPDAAEPARLRVSFFLFFAADYRVISLDGLGYSWGMVTSGSRKYLWILSRSSEMDEELYTKLVGQAARWGFPVDQLIRVSQAGDEKEPY